MRNKYLTYVLAALVVFIWGTIVYRIFFNAEDVTVPTEIRPLLKEKEQRDTTADYHLQLDYQDPFLRGARTVRKRPTTSAACSTQRSEKRRISGTVKFAPAMSTERVSWPKIVYGGSIKSNQKTTAILSIDGTSFFLSQGQVGKEVQIQKIMDDSIVVSYKNKLKTIKK